MEKKEKYKQFSAGDVTMWIELGGSIHLKAKERADDRRYNDPVELTEDEARQIGEYLIYLADELEKTK